MAYTIKHTNTSTANAANVQMVCVFANLVIPNAEVTAGKVSKVNDTTVIAKPNGHTVNALNLGNVLCRFYMITTSMQTYHLGWLNSGHG